MLKMRFELGVGYWRVVHHLPLTRALASSPFLLGAEFQHLSGWLDDLLQRIPTVHTFWEMISNLFCTQYSCAMRSALRSTSVHTRMRSLRRL